MYDYVDNDDDDDDDDDDDFHNYCYDRTYLVRLKVVISYKLYGFRKKL